MHQRSTQGSTQGNTHKKTSPPFAWLDLERKIPGKNLDKHLHDRSSLRRKTVIGGALVSILAGTLVEPALAQSNAADSTTVDLEKVVVSSRNREEFAQDVPIPVSVIGGTTLDREGIVAIEDLVKKAPGLEATTPNSRRTGISIRGIGKSAGNDALEASMGVIVDNVFLSHPGMSYQDFTDLDRVEVLRGPQGTLLGKNTTIGAINYVSKLPSFTPEASANVSLSSKALDSRSTRSFNTSASNAIVDGLLAYRVSFFSDKQDGDIENVNAEGGRTHEKNRSGGRLQFLLTPDKDLSVRLNLDSAESNERSNTKPVIRVLTNYDDAANAPRVTTPGGTAIPTTQAQVNIQNGGKNTYLSLFNRAYFGGYTPIVGSWTQEDINLNVPVLTNNQGASAEVNWDVAGLRLTSITAARKYTFDAKNDGDQTGFAVTRNGTRVDAQQESQEFRLTSLVNEKFDYQVGLFYMHSWNTSNSRTLYGSDGGAYSAKNGDYNALYNTAAGKQLLQASLNNVYIQNVTTPDTKSAAAFGQLNWHFSDAATLTVGLRDTSEKKTSSATKQASLYDGSALNNLTALGGSLGATALEIAAANDIRNGQVGATYGTRQGNAISNNSLGWLVSPSYKLEENVLLYASASSGQKSGSVQFLSNGTPNDVAPEKVFDLEAGFKSSLLNHALLLNVNLYQTTVKDYQQTTSVFDPTTTALRNDGTLYYQSILGNIPKIRARGVEFDSTWLVNRNLSVNFGGAINHAKYADWHTATCPIELNVSSSTTTCDNTGKQVVAAPKFIGIAGLDYKLALNAGYTGHLWVNNVYRTRQNFDATLSRYGVQKAYSLTDIGFGWIAPQGKFEIDLVAKNAFDKQYTTSINISSDGQIAYDGIGARRWIGLVLHARI
jgi:iron complex outermembrane receptor protein